MSTELDSRMSLDARDMMPARCISLGPISYHELKTARAAIFIWALVLGNGHGVHAFNPAKASIEVLLWNKSIH